MAVEFANIILRNGSENDAVSANYQVGEPVFYSDVGEIVLKKSNGTFASFKEIEEGSGEFTIEYMNNIDSIPTKSFNYVKIGSMVQLFTNIVINPSSQTSQCNFLLSGLPFAGKDAHTFFTQSTSLNSDISLRIVGSQLHVLMNTNNSSSPFIALNSGIVTTLTYRIT